MPQKSSHQHTYRERSQPANRKRLGRLEKKKDWLSRAKDHKNKKEQLLKLKRNAENKNADEFYMGMVGKNLKKGKLLDQENSYSKKLSESKSNKSQLQFLEKKPKFKTDEEEDDYLDDLLKNVATASKNKKQDSKNGKNSNNDSDDSDDEITDQIDFTDENLLRTVDINLIRMRYAKEKKILQRMKASVSFQETKKPKNKQNNQHIHFASDEEEAQEIIQRNKLKKQRLKEKDQDFENFRYKNGGENSEKIAKKMLSKYRMLSEQISKVENLGLLLSKMESRRNVANDKRSCKVIEGETGTKAGQYYWPTQRYR